MTGTVITSGVDSEYVLGELAAYLRINGINVMEFDFGLPVMDVKQALQDMFNHRLVYLTSAHTNLSVRVAQQIVPIFAENYPNYLCPLEIIPLLGANCTTIYVPHDLLTPYGDDNLQEIRFLNVFDHIFAPNDAKALKATIGGKTEVHEVGWIKYNSQNYKELYCSKSSELKVTVFVSMIEHLRHKFGLQGLIEYLRPLMRPGYVIKLPAWHGVKIVEDALRNSGFDVIPADVSSIELIRRSDVVICNGASSIHAESSYLGRPTICMLDDEGISSDTQRKKLSSLPNILFMDRETLRSITREEMINISMNKSTRAALVFDFDYAVGLVKRALADDNPPANEVQK